MRKEPWEHHEIQVKNQERSLVVEQLNQPVFELHCLWYSDYTENISSFYLFNLSAFLKQKTYIIIKKKLQQWSHDALQEQIQHCVRFKKTGRGLKTSLYLQ